MMYLGTIFAWACVPVALLGVASLVQDHFDRRHARRHDTTRRS